MGRIKKFINRHKWLSTIFSIVFIGLPQYIESTWSLAERILGRTVEMPDITWGYWVTVPLGLIMFGVAIWAIRSKTTVKDRETPVNESKPSPIEQNKSLQTQNQLDIGALLGYVHAHKCSKCGWGIRAGLFNRVVTCPKCGNVDNVYERNDAKTGNK